MDPSASAGLWCNPPPPGTTDEDLAAPLKPPSPGRAIDRIDPFLKSPEYVKYERRRRSRSRSRSRSRHRRHRSRDRHKRRRRSRSRRRRRSRSRSHRRRRRSRSRKRSRSRSRSRQKAEPETKDNQEELEEEEDDDESNENMFKNDGSFMEMFKKMQEERMTKGAEAANEGTAGAPPQPPPPSVGKRRGGKVLKTGMVQKSKMSSQEEADAQDAWTLYMKEVKRYKEACCDDDSKTRLLVK